jgi:hypothetical protein
MCNDDSEPKHHGSIRHDQELEVDALKDPFPDSRGGVIEGPLSKEAIALFYIKPGLGTMLVSYETV